MSNGIGANPLNAISKVYLEQIAEKKDDSYLEPDMKKRQANNEKARKEMEKVKGQKNPHFEEKDPFGRPDGKHGGVPKKGGGYDKAYQANMKKVKELDKKEGWDAVNALADAYKEMYQVDENRAAMGRIAREYKKRKEEEGMKKRMADHADKMKNDPEYAAKRRAQDKIHREELELDENRRAARAAGGYKDDSKKQTDPSKAGFTGISGSIKDIMRQNKEIEAKNKAKSKTEGLDPVGKEDSDVNNDGKKDSTDSYLMKRRKAIGNAIKGKMKKEEVENVEELYKGKHGQTEKQYQDSRSDAGKMVSGDSKMSGSKYAQGRRTGSDAGPQPAGGSQKPASQGKMDSGSRTDLQFRKAALKKKEMKEAYSSWRQDLSEIMTDDIDSKPIKEKKNIKNSIKINPKLGESVEQLGGEILEMVEVDQFDGIVEEVFQDLLSEGYSEQLVRAAIEEATVTYGHDTSGDAEGMRDKLKKKAKGFLGKVAVKAYNKAREAKAAATPAVQRAKTSAKRGIRKMALKVADKLKEENVDEAVYGGTPPEKKDTRMVVTNADKKANTPAYQKMKAGDKRYKAADHMNEGDGDPCWDSHKQVGMKKKGNRMVPNCVPKNEEVEVSEEGSMSAQEIALQKRKSTIDQMIARKRRQELDQGKKEKPTKAMGEETEDSLRDRRMERGGVDGNNRYNKPISNTPNTFGKKKPKYDGMSALEKVKADIRAKHGKGAIKEDAKMAKQSDEKLAALHKQVSSSDQSLPSNQFMMKRVTKEMNRRKKAT